MTKFNNPLARKTVSLQGKSAEIKGWAREALNIEANTPITVAELACRDEDCPDIETVIGVLEPGRTMTTLRVHVPMKDVQKGDVLEAANSTTQAASLQSTQKI
ncbi:MAG: nitrate reductase [Pseudomonadota bacterium]